ncbi:MAG: Activator of Hsp90 ATPase 1 family protein [Solirubrobacterales bacterium]|nr:Activator of Hsp90 ATPase 1 family protein [Solirubrobacterales bacterium]
MAADSIEREILIEASPEVVWGVITEPEQISRWFSDAAEVEGRAGAEGTLTWRPGGRGGAKEFDSIVLIRVVEAEPFRRFSFRWNHPHGAGADENNSALVEFSLIEEADGTRLRVVESGIDAVTRDEQSKARYLEDHEQGWERHLGEMLDYVASKPRGATR